jgi:adenylate kinase
MDQTMSNYVLLGPPGAGKGTMAAMMASDLGVLHVSTGDILRKEIQQDSELGRRAQATMDRGQLVPDELVAAIVDRLLQQPDAQQNGCAFDGYPRTIPQAEMLDEALDRNQLVLAAAVLLEVDEQLLLKRLSARRVCPQCGALFNVLTNPPENENTCDHCRAELVQREDDRPETIKERLRVYQQQTAPVVAFYEQRNALLRVEANGSPAGNYAALRERLDSRP